MDDYIKKKKVKKLTITAIMITIKIFGSSSQHEFIYRLPCYFVLFREQKALEKCSFFSFARNRLTHSEILKYLNIACATVILFFAIT